MKYFDYAATTPVRKEVLDTYVKVSETFFAHAGVNPEVQMLEDQSKEVILDCVGFNKNNYELIFTSGGSEANNLGIIGYAQTFESKKHFITSAYEHSSAHESFEYLEEIGHEVTYVLPNKEGIIEASNVVEAIRPNTVLVEIMHVNNEIGTINQVDQIAKAIKAVDNKIVFMTDSVQGLGKTKINDFSNIDMFSGSAHKVYGPKACGMLIKRKGIKLGKIIRGGNLENDYRGGTQSLAAQVAFAKAVKLMYLEFDKVNQDVTSKRDYLVEQLLTIDGVSLNVPSKSNVVSIRVDMDMKAESVVTQLLKDGFAVSTKSACSTKMNKGSRSLSAIGLNINEQDHTFRISISHLTSKADIDSLVADFKRIIDLDKK